MTLSHRSLVTAGHLVAAPISRRGIDDNVPTFGLQNDTNSFTAAFAHVLHDGRTTSLPSHPHPLFAPINDVDDDADDNNNDDDDNDVEDNDVEDDDDNEDDDNDNKTTSML